MPTFALYSVCCGEELARLWVIPSGGEGTAGKLQGNLYRAITKHITDVLFARLSEGKDIKLALCLDGSQFIMGCHSPKLDLVVGKEVEQVLTAAEDFRRWRA